MSATNHQEKYASVVKIREAECIGCTKCIAVCPTDAIIGASQYMHTVIIDACIGCNLCLPPCPVDCIDIIRLPIEKEIRKKAHSTAWKKRHQERQARLLQEQNKVQQITGEYPFHQTIDARRSVIQEAIVRAKAKKKRFKNEPNQT